jgi:hypothetical protein
VRGARHLYHYLIGGEAAVQCQRHAD